MKAEELRIGNYVFEDYGGEYQVLMISPNYIDLVKPLMSASGRYRIEPIKPIPLTEEWLLKFEFEKDSDGCLVKNKYMYWLDVGFIQIAVGYTAITNVPCKYVHQLQNLYFALTGEELTIKN